MTGCNVILVRLENVAEKLGQGGYANAPGSMNANEQVRVLKAEVLAGVAEVDMNALIELRVSDRAGGLKNGTLRVCGFPGLRA